MKPIGNINIQKAFGWLAIISGIGFLSVPIVETPPLSHFIAARVGIAILFPGIMLAAVIFGGKKMIKWILAVPAVYFAGSMIVWYCTEKPGGEFLELITLVTVILIVFLLLSGILLFGGWQLVHPVVIKKP